jgi:hypothetical protein
MGPASTALAAFLMAGAPSHTDMASMVPTADRQYTYVAAEDCRRGHGWLWKSDLDGKGMRKVTIYFIGANTDAATLATILCYPYTHPRTKL